MHVIGRGDGGSLPDAWIGREDGGSLPDACDR